jgi:hypothetical protein
MLRRADMKEALEVAQLHSQCKDDVRPRLFPCRMLLNHGDNVQDTHLYLLRKAESSLAGIVEVLLTQPDYADH